MADNENNEQRDAFTEKLKGYIEFASIVQNYDATSHVEHDDIDFEHDPDGAEYDNNGEPVTLYGVVIYNFENRAAERAEWRQDYPDDSNFLNWNDDEYDDDEEYDNPAYRFPLYDPRKRPCNHRTGSFYWLGDIGTPPV